MSIINNAKEIADIVKKLGNLELYRKIVELEGEIIELTREKRQAEDKIRDLEEILNTAKSMTYKNPFYYGEGDPMPYCAKCWETAKVAVHLIDMDLGAGEKRYDCPNCKTMIIR